MRNETEFTSTELYLIRHGQAVVNVEPIIGGMKGDRGLTPLGVQQAERLRDRLQITGEIRADVVIASTLPRARQTAEILQPAFDLPILWDDAVQEFRSGDDADGLTLTEYEARYGWIDIDANPFQRVDPGGESWAGFTFRIASALDQIVQYYAGKTIVVVCHGGVIDASFLYFMGLSGFVPPRTGLDTRNTSITCWRQALRRDRVRWVLDRYNDDAHLRGLVTANSMVFLTDAPEQPAVPTEG